MTTEEKNTVLAMARGGAKKTEIARALDGRVSSQYLGKFCEGNKWVERFAKCPNCGAEFAIPLKRGKGRTRVFCSDKCKRAFNSKRRKKGVTLICEECGREYLQFSFRKSRFCSRSCAQKHVNGKRKS